MSDYIDRQAVLASIKNLYPDMPVMDIMGARQKWLEKYAPYFECENAVEQLPSVENKGEWIKIQSGDKDFPESIVCSKCKNENSHLDFNEHGEPIGKVFVTSNFCPNCGADMREPKGIIHKAIDNTTFAEEAYPNIKEELHKAVVMREPKGEKTNAND